eukprot:gene13520-11137_t
MRRTVQTAEGLFGGWQGARKIVAHDARPAPTPPAA